MKNKLIYVIAGDYEEAKSWANQKGIREWEFVEDVSLLEDSAEGLYQKIGTWASRSDVKAIEERLHSSRGFHSANIV